VPHARSCPSDRGAPICDGLRRAIGKAHRRYARRGNFREGWRGHLRQGRSASFALDESNLLTAARYVELNPVRAGLRDAPSRYRVCSASAHLRGRGDALVRAAPFLAVAGNWRRLLISVIREEDLKVLRGHEHTGRRWVTRPSWHPGNRTWAGS